MFMVNLDPSKYKAKIDYDELKILFCRKQEDIDLEKEALR